MTDAINNASREPRLSNEQHCMAALTPGALLPPLPHNHQQADEKLFFYNKAANCSRKTQEQVLKSLLGELGSAPLERFQSQPWRGKNRAAKQRFAKGEEGDSTGRREALGNLAATVMSSLINPRATAGCSSSQLSSSPGSIPARNSHCRSRVTRSPSPPGQRMLSHTPLLSSATAAPAAPTDPQRTAEEAPLGSDGDSDHLQGGNGGQLP